MNYAEYGSKLKIVSDPKRMKIIDLLSNGEMCACDILDHFDFTQPTLSHHMKVLEKVGFVNVVKRGTWHHYSLNRTELNTFKTEFDRLFSCSDD